MPTVLHGSTSTFLNPNTPAHPHITGTYIKGVLLAYAVIFVLVCGVVVLRVLIVHRTVQVRRGVEEGKGQVEKGRSRRERVQEEGLSKWEVL